MPPLFSLGREVQIISEMIYCNFYIFEKCGMSKIQTLMVLNGLSSIFFLQKLRAVGRVQFYECGKVKESELQSQVLTVVDLNYCDVRRVPRI